MMNKVKALLALTVVLALPVLASAGPGLVNVRRDQNGFPVDPRNGGYLHMRNSGTSEMIVCSGRCLLAGILMSTGPSSTFITVRNTSVAQGNGALVLPRYTRFAQVNTQPGSNNLLPTGGILLDKGISVTLSSVSADEDVTVLYLDLDD